MVFVQVSVIWRARRYSQYTAAVREAGILVDWAHFYFATHAHHALRVGRGLRPTLHSGIDFNLIRLNGGTPNLST